MFDGAQPANGGVLRAVGADGRSGAIDVGGAEVQTESFGFSDETQPGVDRVRAIEAVAFVREQLDLVAASTSGVAERCLDDRGRDPTSAMRRYDHDCLDERRRRTVVGDVRHQHHRRCPHRVMFDLGEIDAQIRGCHHPMPHSCFGR